MMERKTEQTNAEEATPRNNNTRIRIINENMLTDRDIHKHTHTQSARTQSTNDSSVNEKQYKIITTAAVVVAAAQRKKKKL